MGNVLINVTPFKPILRESKERPGVFEVEGLCRELVQRTKTVEFTKKILMREVKKYMD